MLSKPEVQFTLVKQEAVSPKDIESIDQYKLYQDSLNTLKQCIELLSKEDLFDHGYSEFFSNYSSYHTNNKLHISFDVLNEPKLILRSDQTIEHRMPYFSSPQNVEEMYLFVGMILEIGIKTKHAFDIISNEGFETFLKNQDSVFLKSYITTGRYYDHMNQRGYIPTFINQPKIQKLIEIYQKSLVI